MYELESYQLGVISLGAIAFGVYLLIKGGDWTIDNAISLAENSGLSKIFIAATIVAFGTSAPELFTSINANISGYPGISVGNVIGSNIANVMLVVAVSAIIAPIVVERSKIRVDILVMICATAAMVVGVIHEKIPRWGGFVMVSAIIFYILYQYRASKLDVEDVEGSSEEGWKVWGMLVLGLVALLIGSEILVQGAIAGGLALGVSEAVIGMTMIALGTSLPELTACVAAARKGQYDMVVGGIIGSNIFNILSVMALSAVAKPLLIDSSFAKFDVPVVVVVTTLFSVLLVRNERIGRVAGVSMLSGYAAFISFQYLA